jgi:sulfite exporter TauE/SafE
LLANFENRLLGRTVSGDWIGVAPALVGLGIALLPLADQFNLLKSYAVPGGVALILAGLLLCLVPIWKRIQARHEAKPRSLRRARADQVADDEPLAMPSRTAKG